MDDKTAQSLLDRMKQDKINQDSKNLIGKVLLTALGGGMAVRGLTGLSNVLKPTQQYAPPSTADFEVPYGSKKKEKEAVDAFDNPWTMPAVMLGGPAAFYGGWKGIDKLLDRQRKGKTEDELKAEKDRYRKALIAAYKTAEDENKTTDELLEGCFSKSAAGIWDSFERAGNLGKGLALTYGIAAPLAAYSFVNDKMQSSSRRAVLEKALRERARRRAKQQPFELYATPEQVDIPEDSEE